MKSVLNLSNLGHTWILDIDGTLVKHNGYKTEDGDSLIEGVKEFFEKIPKDDMVVLITSRTEEYREQTEAYLQGEKVRYNHIIYNAPFGERIIINDRKPSGLDTAIAVNLERDIFRSFDFHIDMDK